MTWGWWVPGRMPAKPWSTHGRQRVGDGGPWATLYRDSVTRPDGSQGDYVWVDAPDMVRVLLVLPGDRVVIVQQWHYLTGPAWQLPGGSVDPDRDGDPLLVGLPDPHLAAMRELEEETGIIPGELRSLGTWETSPGLTKQRVHVYTAHGAITTRATRREATEADLDLIFVPFADVVRAATDGRIRCAASAAGILAAATERPRP